MEVGPLSLAVRDCAIHKTHNPRIDRSGGLYTTERHHIWPLGELGVDQWWNVIPACPSGHTAAHELQRAWKRRQGEPEWEIRRFYHPLERVLGQAAWEASKVFAEVVARSTYSTADERDSEGIAAARVVVEEATLKIQRWWS